MIEYIALGLVIIKYALDYIAPRTKTKWDDRAEAVMDELPLPSLPEAAKAAADKAMGPADPVSKPVEGFGTARDHRKP